MKEIVSEYYTPLKKTQSELQKFKNNYKSFTQDKKMNVPKFFSDVTKIRNRNFAIEYLNNTIDKKLTKTEFCKSKRIAVKTLNKGLELVGIKNVPKNGNKMQQLEINGNKRKQLETKRKILNRGGSSNDYDSVLKDVEKMNLNLI